MPAWRGTALVAAVAVAASGCASYHPGPMPTSNTTVHPNKDSKAGVTVAASVFTDEETKYRLDARPQRRGIQPLFVVIENGSTETYRFQKDQVEPAVVPAKDAAKAGYRHTVLRTVFWTFVAVPSLAVALFTGQFFWALGLPIGAATQSRRVNKEIREQFVANEIPDGPVAPGQRLSGLLFIKPGHGGTLRIVLVNTRTQESPVFDLPLEPRKGL